MEMQLFGGNDTTYIIIQTIWILLFFILIFFGQRIQLQMTLLELGSMLSQLGRMREYARMETYNKLKEYSGDENVLRTMFNNILESFVILPEDMDPAGIVRKVEHIIDTREDKFLNDMTKMLSNPNLDEPLLKKLSNMVEATLALETLYKITRHYYLLAKKTGNVYIAMQLQIQAPQLFNYAKAYLQAVYAFKNGTPIGDSIGPLIIHKFIPKLSDVKVVSNFVKDIDLYVGEFNKRKIYLIKAHGPGGNVGKPGEAIKKILEENKDSVKLVITIDAALKLEGEKTGSVAEGVGAAIGGIGVEKFKIEEVATKYNIPTYAMVIKMDLNEAISVIKKDIVDAIPQVLNRLESIIVENSSEGDSIIIAGIGNTIGVP